MARASRLLGEVALARNELNAALISLQEALNIARQIGQPAETWKAHEALARLHAEAGRADQAELSCRAAIEVLVQVEARAPPRTSCARLEHRPTSNACGV
jgi:tetratricopeptide (TPR) repeat protein